MRLASPRSVAIALLIQGKEPEPTTQFEQWVKWRSPQARTLKKLAME
jgi:hypothetical protein